MTPANTAPESIRLHCFSQSGNCFKVGFMLNALGQPWTPVFVDFMNGVSRTADWRATLNPMGEAPVLDIDGKRMTQSGVMLMYLADKFGRFGGASLADRDEALRWLFFDNHKFTSYFASYRFAKAFGSHAPDPAVMAWLKARMDSAFSIVNDHLAQRDFLLGKNLSVADFSLCGYRFYPLEESGYDVRERFPHIHAWAERLKHVPGWQDPYALMPGARIVAKW